MGEFERIQEISDAAVGRVGNELTITFPEVLKVIELCSANQIAVLGVELFLVKADGYYASGCSDYDLQEKQRWPAVHLPDWPEFVRFKQ
jgi:hypothetical protein